MERNLSEPSLTVPESLRPVPQLELNVSQEDLIEVESADMQITRKGQQAPITQNFMETGPVSRTPKIITSMNSGTQVRSQKRDDLSQTKFLVNQDDFEKLALYGETVERAKDFRERSKKLDFITPLASKYADVLPATQKLVVRSGQQSPAQSQIKSQRSILSVEKPEIEYMLEAIHEIIHADPIQKHQVEVEQIQIITRVISSARYGENCLDVLRYISNMRKHFNESLTALESLNNQAKDKFGKTREAQSQLNNALSQEIEKGRKLSNQLKQRTSENSVLKSQLEQCLQALNQRDVVAPEDQQLRQKVVIQEEDSKREQDIVSLSSKIESELQSSKGFALMENFKTELSAMLKENRENKSLSQQLEIKLEAQTRNLNYLEEKLAEALTEREEQVVELKSQIIIQKQKAHSYKQKLQAELEEFKKEVQKGEVDQCFKDKQQLEIDISRLRSVLNQKDAEIDEYKQQALRHISKQKQMEKENYDQIEERETKIQTLQEQIQRIEKESSTKLQTQIQRVTTEKRAFNVLEQEQQVKNLRLEYLESNQKKIQQQKKFLEDQVGKDIRDMQQQMIKTSLEIKKDQLISSQSALQRLEQMYLLMQNSLRHVTRVVSFMTFDQDSQVYGNVSSLEEHEQEEQLQDLPQIPVSSPQAIQQLRNNLFNEPSTQDQTVEQILQKFPYELMESLASWIQDYFKNSNGPPTDEIEQLISLVRQKTSPTRVEDIQRHFLAANRLHYEQFVFRLNERASSLQSERDRLQAQLAEMHQEMQQVFTSLDQNKGEKWEQQQTMQIGNKDKDTIELSPIKKALSKIDPNDKQAADNIKSTLMKRMNEALSERVRDIKLILNRRYFELEDNMKLQKEKYEMEITQLKVQYGKDLNLVHLDNKKALALQRKEMSEQHKNDIQTLKNQLGEQFKKLKSDFEENLRKINKEKIEERIKKENYHSELKKQKKESTGLYQAAFGTFTIAFENPLHSKLTKAQQQLVDLQKEQEVLKASLTGAKTKTRNKLVQAHLEKEDETQKQCQKLQKAVEEIEIIPKEKLEHFIQVGFQISEKNFLPLVTYNELAYESMAKKHVYEFQDQIEPTNEDEESDRVLPIESGVLQLENKLRQQISDNFALFNEINPIYISLNMGRPINQFSDQSLPIEKFRLTERLSANIASQYLTVNFLRTDLPFSVLRIVAFNNQTCQQYEIDLNKEDLLIFIEGNSKLLEEENSSDLYQLILNSLTLITRVSQTRGGPFSYQVLALEHRCFFNELYRQHWDARNKLIRARHNKIKQGLVNEVALLTDFNQSIIYEGFVNVFESEVCLELTKDSADHFMITLQRGQHSGHLKLIVKLMYAADVEQTLCLVKSDLEDQGKVQNLAAAILQKPDIGDGEQALAYIISMEKLFGSVSEESLIVKVTSVQKKMCDQMKNFKWQGEGPPNNSSTKSVSKSIYLTRKIGTPSRYCQVQEFEILNTEVRSQLFAHAFGYDQRIVDFGDTSTEANNLSDLNNSFNLSGNVKTQNLKDYARTDLVYSQNQANDTSVKLKTLAPIQHQTSLNQLLMRQFTIIRVISIDEMGEEDLVSQYAQVAFKTNLRLQEQLLIEVSIQMPETDIDLCAELSPLTVLSRENYQIFLSGDKQEELGFQLIDQLTVVMKNDKAAIQLDKKIQPFSQLLNQLKQQQFDDNIAKIGLVQFQLEFPYHKMIQISKTELANCKKMHKVTLIGQRPFKVTCYFIMQLRDKKVKKHNIFNFDCMYIQAFNSTLDQTFEIYITEHDIATLVEMVQEATQHKTAIEYQIDCKKLLNSKLTQQQLFSFVLDVLQFDPMSLSIVASFEQLLNKLVERKKLEIAFMNSGGGYVTSQEIASAVPSRYLKRTLLTNLDKDVSNSKINIKVYRCELQSLPGLVKLDIEIFDIEEPSIVFKVQYLTSQEGVTNQILVERFSLADETYRRQNPAQTSEYNENGLNRGLVLSISEAAFPHEITLMLLEPCSHIFWHYVVKDDKINRIEKRNDKQAFAINLDSSLQNEICRYSSQETSKRVKTGYQRNQVLLPNQSIEIIESEMRQLGSLKEGELDLAYGKTFQPEKSNHFVEVKLQFNFQAQKLIFDWIEKSHEDQIKVKQQWQYTVLQEAECSRVYQGSMRSFDGSQLLCSIEQATASSSKNYALRVQVSRIVTENGVEKLFDLLITDPSLLKDDFVVREDLKFALGLGFRDTQATVIKMDDFARDVALSKLKLLPIITSPQKREDNWKLVCRKIINDDECNFVISAMSKLDTQMFKLNVFETNTVQQHVFVFNTSDVLTKEELNSLVQKPELINKYIIEAVNNRLVIRQLDFENKENDRMKPVLPESNNQQSGFSASFLNPAVIMNKSQNKVALNQIFPEIDDFDIRNDCMHSFFEPSELFDQPAKQKQKTTLMTQFVKDDYLYDVYQIMDPFQLKLKVQLYHNQTFQLIASAQCEEEAIKHELQRDKKSHLLEGHLREELAKYLVSNSTLDERRQLLFFQKSEFLTKQGTKKIQAT